MSLISKTKRRCNMALVGILAAALTGSGTPAPAVEPSAALVVANTQSPSLLYRLTSDLLRFRVYLSSDKAKRLSDAVTGAPEGSSAGTLVCQKQACRPEYAFRTVRKTYWLLKDGLSLPKPEKASASNKALRMLSAGSCVEIVGENDLIFWKTPEGYIDHRLLTADRSEAFQKVERQPMYIASTAPLFSQPQQEEIASQAQVGETVEVTGRNAEGLLRIEKDGQTAFVAEEKLTDEAAYALGEVDRTCYTSVAACLLDAPDPDGNTLYTTKVNDKVHVTGIGESKYWRCEVADKVGFINSTYLSSSPIVLFPAPSSGSSSRTQSRTGGAGSDATGSTTGSNQGSGSESGGSASAGRNAASDGHANASGADTADGCYKGAVWTASAADLDLMCAIVKQEGGSSYTSALAVMSSAVNRCWSSRWGYIASHPLGQLTASGQYCYSIDGLHARWMNGNYPAFIRQAVKDGLDGVTNHPYTCFRSYPGNGSVTNIGGNWYFGS